MPHCILDIHKLSYFASSLWHTRHLHTVPFSIQCRTWLASSWLVEMVGIPCCIIWGPSTLPPTCIRSLIKLSLKFLCDNLASQELRIMKLFSTVKSSKWKNSFFVHFHIHLLMEYVFIMWSLLSTYPTCSLYSCTIAGFKAFPCSSWNQRVYIPFVPPDHGCQVTPHTMP